MTTPASETEPGSDRRRVVIHAACTCPGVANGYANLVVRKLDGQIELDPHVTGACVLVLDEDAAGALRDVLIEWLG